MVNRPFTKDEDDIIRVLSGTRESLLAAAEQFRRPLDGIRNRFYKLRDIKKPNGTTPRKCLNCQNIFESTGIGNRMCPNCK